MSPARVSRDLGLRAACVASDILPTDRRSHRRYPVELDLEYRLMHYRRVLKAGLGKTCDISAKGVFFRADQALPKGLDVELSMDWPFRLDGRWRLQVKIDGKVLRSGESGTAVQIRNYEFRTRGSRPVLADRAHAKA
jgi:PilZ domain